MHNKFYLQLCNAASCFLLLTFCLVFTKPAIAQPVLALSPVIETGLSTPIQFVNAGDGSNRVFIVQQGGTIRAYDASFNFLSTFLTVSDVNFSGERGLLSMAFHPDYQNNGFFFVYYVNTAGNLEIARYHISASPNIADPASKVIVITIPHPTNSNHNGGELHFGNDGYLYLSTGDGGGGGDGPNNAQNTSVLLGKMLRFNVNTSATAPFYTIPAGNPYGNEIFDLGLRNPYRWSFDRQTFDMWIGDVGQDSYEEINFRAAGATGGVNYGWRCYEGNTAYNTAGCQAISNYVFPAYNYPSQNPSAAITGGIVYRGTSYPAMQGYNISADFFSGIFYKTVSNGAGGWTTTTQTLAPTGIVDFGETEDGEAYVVSLTTGSVFRLIISGTTPVRFLGFTGTLNSRGVNLSWQTAAEENMKEFEIEYSTNGRSFSTLGKIASQNAATGARYSFLHAINYSGAVFYRLKIVNTDGYSTYSTIVRIVLNNNKIAIVVPSVITSGIMNIDLSAQSYNSLELISMNGNVVLQKNIAGQVGQLKVSLNKVAAGVYTVRLVGNAATAVQKVFIQ
ncbi:MAG: PQQ-dependent sugar dehydrogenase [Ferruginibacter sp.]